jgi:glycosyltransferase involved in cell wall biosynthesis
VIVPTPQIDEVVHKYKPMTVTFLLPTGIEPELFDHDESEGAVFREKLEGRFPRLKGKRILLFAGRIGEEKNLALLLRILPAILVKHPDVVLLFVGNGPDLDYFRDEAQKAGLEEKTVFTGYMERRELALVYTIAEVFVFPSLTDTQGLVTLEAMLSGAPVVAIGALGTLQVMGGDNGGFMVKNAAGTGGAESTAAEFTDRVLDLLGNPELRRMKSLEAKIHARAWSIEELTKRLVVIYESTVKSYLEDYGDPRTPVWELLTDKRWWKINNKIFRKRTKQIWHRMRSRLPTVRGNPV